MWTGLVDGVAWYGDGDIPGTGFERAYTTTELATATNTLNEYFAGHELAQIRRRVRVSTEDLGVKGYSQLIDRVSAFAATELGVTFPATFQQWEGMQVDPDTGEIL